MPRARWLKPEFFRDAKVAELGPVGAVVFQALWIVADDGGVAPCDPDRLKGEMFFAWSAVGVPEITGALRHLFALGRVRFHQGGDELFCQIVNWRRHQFVHKPSKFRWSELYAKQGKEFVEVVPEWCSTGAGVVGHSPLPRLLDSKTPKEPSADAVRPAGGGDNGDTPAEPTPAPHGDVPGVEPEDTRAPESEPPTGDHPAPPPARSRAAREGQVSQHDGKPNPAREWARPYYEAWVQRFGGQPDVGFLRKKVEPLERRDGRDVTVRRWEHLVAGLSPRFFSAKGDPFKNAVLKLVGAPAAYDDPQWHLSDRDRAEVTRATEGLFT